LESNKRNGEGNKAGCSDPYEEVIRFLGVKCPSSAQVWLGRHAELPLHQKMVTTINLEAVSRLSSIDPEAPARWAQARRWLSDESLYSEVPFDGRLPKPRLETGDLETMIKAGVIRPMLPSERPRGALRIFTVAEVHKHRRRPIKWPQAVNETCGRDTLQSLTVVPRAEVRRQVKPGEVAILVDMAQWFDQIPLGSKVQSYFCLDGGHLGPCALTRLPMGQRQATEVATAVTARLLDFACDEGVVVAYAADNVRFVGPRKGILSAFRCFLKRCAEVGVQLNELKQCDYDNAQQVEALVTKQYDFLGETYDHAAALPKMRSTEKTMAKLRTTWSERAGWTVRRMACHMGILLYTSSTARIPLSKYFGTMRFFASLARAAQADESVWDRPLVGMPVAVQRELAEWTSRALANRWVPIPDYDASAPDITICSDASGWGFGSIAVFAESGLVRMINGPWPAGSSLTGAGSVSTEPAGVKAALCAFVPPTSRARVLVLTDHEPLVAAARAGYAKAYTYNQLLDWIGINLAATVSFAFVAGVTNPADDLSRGEPAKEESEQARKGVVEGLARGFKVTSSTAPFGAPWKAQWQGTPAAGDSPS
jgi:hypothetical protein